MTGRQSRCGPSPARPCASARRGLVPGPPRAALFRPVLGTCMEVPGEEGLGPDAEGGDDDQPPLNSWRLSLSAPSLDGVACTLPSPNIAWTGRWLADSREFL